VSALRVKIIAKTASWLCQDLAESMADQCRHELAHVRTFREMVVKGLRADTPRKVDL
jgi:hypothetical protein